ncbi:hypothetical protein ACLMJK_006261 [Lecanora helva]
MNHEKQNGVPKRRPLPGAGVHSPRVITRGNKPTSVTNSPVTDGKIVATKEIRSNGVETEYGYPDGDVSTPVKTFWSSNITPRSNSRKARAETSSPITIGSPVRAHTASNSISKYESTNSRNAEVVNGLGLRTLESGRNNRSKESTISAGQGSSISSNADSLQRFDPASRVSSPESVPKFFHANDFKPSASRATSELSVPQQDENLRNDVQIKESAVVNGRTSFCGQSPVQDGQETKFFYANELNDSKPPPLKLLPGNNADRPPLHTIYSANNASSPPRPSSPLKEETSSRPFSMTKPSPRRHTRLVSGGSNVLKSPAPISSDKKDLSRRSSLHSPREKRQSTPTRSPSVPATRLNSQRRPSVSVADGSVLERTRTTSTAGSYGSLPHGLNPPSKNHELPRTQLTSQPPSPTKPSSATGQSKIDQMNELAANARRERKVLDLEISNSSLLAINRTLEREMHKQNAELRRFRRLSRSGRISIAPSSRSASGKMSVLTETDTNIDIDDLFPSSEDEVDSENESSNISATAASSRPSSPTARAARIRFQDPNHVELDLAAHRALLADSQKMNISIKRCLDHSESLIASGKKALEYQPQVRDEFIKGGRVLTPEDIDDGYFGQSQGLLSPAYNRTDLNPWERSLGNTGSLDSGLRTPEYSNEDIRTSLHTSPPGIPETMYESDGNDDDAKLQDNSRHAVSDAIPNGARLDLEADTQRGSDIVSIDGLDEEVEKSPQNKLEDDRRIDIEHRDTRAVANEIYNAASRAASPERKEQSPQLGQPGFRGSMQGLGHYLQAFSVFGSTQQS